MFCSAWLEENHKGHDRKNEATVGRMYAREKGARWCIQIREKTGCNYGHKRSKDHACEKVKNLVFCPGPAFLFDDLAINFSTFLWGKIFNLFSHFTSQSYGYEFQAPGFRLS